MPSTSPDILVAARGIWKDFGGADVLKDARIDLRAGEVHGILGENGAGKSTLAKVIAGVHTPRAGDMIVNDNRMIIAHPRMAIAHGIALIHQEPLTFPDLTVAENVFIGRQPRTRFGTVHWREMHHQAGRLLAQLGAKIDPRAKLRGLSIADAQMVEMAAALSQHARVFLLDETTASLTPTEVAELFRVVRQLKSSGAALAFIGHRMEEVFAICDRLTVLRDGEVVATMLTTDTTVDEVLRLMVGRPIEQMFARTIEHDVGPPLLEVQNLSRAGEFDNINLTVRAGEIVGLAGLVGAGRTEVARAIFGVTRADRGAVRVDGKPVRIRSPRDAMRHGLALVPEDRQHLGLLMPQSIWRNAALATTTAGRLSRLGFVRDRAARALADDSATRLRVKCRSTAQPVRELSGGNQQKVVLAKWLMTGPRVVIFDEPTRGIDVGAKAEVHRLISELAAAGKAVLMISSELPEVLAMSDRVLVMREGRINAEFARRDATAERVIAAATGQTSSLSPVRGGEGAGGASRVTAISSTTSSGAASSGFRGLLAIRELPILAALVVIVAFTAFREPSFLSGENVRGILLAISLVLVLAMGQAVVVLTRGIDVSAGSTMGMAGMTAAVLFQQHHVESLFAGVLVALLVGALGGALNGVLVAAARVPAIIATLGTLGLYRAVSFMVSGGHTVSDAELPRSVRALSVSGPLGEGRLPWLVVVAFVVAIATFALLRYTRLGRHVYAVGGNAEAARLRGVPVKRVVFFAYVFSGMTAGLAGLLYASHYGSVNPEQIGSGRELAAIAAVAVGGVSIFGGAGGVPGVVLGALLLGTIEISLTVLHIDPGWQMTAYGATILAAMTFDVFAGRLRKS